MLHAIADAGDGCLIFGDHCETTWERHSSDRRRDSPGPSCRTILKMTVAMQEPDPRCAFTSSGCFLGAVMRFKLGFLRQGSNDFDRYRGGVHGTKYGAADAFDADSGVCQVEGRL